MAGRPISLTLLGSAARALPPGFDRRLASVAGACTRLAVPRRFDAARRNAAALFPASSPRGLDRLAARACTAYAHFLIEYLRSRERPSELAERTEFAPAPSLVRALEQGRGAVLCGAHVGNWEVGATSLLRLGRPLRVVARPQYAASWRDSTRRSKEHWGIEVSTPDESPRPLLRHLRAGGVVAVLADGDGYARGWAARIAGRAVMLPSGPAQLASRTGAVLGVGIGERIGPYRFRVALEPIAGTGDAPCDDAARMHAALARWLERLLLDRPGEWCLFRPFFPEHAAPAPVAAATPVADPAR